MKKKSFFERLTGAINTSEEDLSFDNTFDEQADASAEKTEGGEDWLEEEQVDAQLSVDVHQTPTEIIIETMVAGVRPDELEVSITREMVTISGKRMRSRTVSDENYFHRELYWGSFSRTILLPEEVEVEDAQAEEHHGLLTIKLPKVDKKRKTKLKIKSN